jgi:hypothetical protein
MEEQNVEVVARWAEALRRGNLGVELWDAELEILNARVGPSRRHIVGTMGSAAGGTTSRRRSRISCWSSRR